MYIYYLHNNIYSINLYIKLIALVLTTSHHTTVTHNYRTFMEVRNVIRINITI